jgi:hypothetical protein
VLEVDILDRLVVHVVLVAVHVDIEVSRASVILLFHVPNFLSGRREACQVQVVLVVPHQGARQPALLRFHSL